MKTILCCILAILLCGCNIIEIDDEELQDRKKAKLERKKQEEQAYTRDYMKTITIDGCEYIIYLGRGGLTHKGNCKNPIHKHNKE